MGIEGRRVALLVEDEFNLDEFIYPFHWFREAGAELKVVGSSRAASFASQAEKRWFSEELFRSLLRVRGMECNAPSQSFDCSPLGNVVMLEPWKQPREDFLHKIVGQARPKTGYKKTI